MSKLLIAIASVLFVYEAHAYTPCSCSESFWVNVDYLYWEIKDSPKIVPLVIQGPVVNEGAPVFKKKGTEIVLGDKKIKNHWRSGGRFSLGYWFNDEHCLGVEGNYFFLPEGSTTHRVASDGSPGSAFLSVPFFNVVTEKESSATLARPGSFRGRAALKNSNHFQGAEINAVMAVPNSCTFDVELLGGVRWVNFDEHLSFKTSSPNVPPFREDVYKSVDKFQVKNNYYGLQIGGKFNYIMDYTCNRFIFNFVGKLAFGGLYQSSDIHGHLLSNDFNGFNKPEKYPGGYFGMETNNGKRRRTCFSIIPEFDFNLGYVVMDCMTVRIGYTFIYVSNVLYASKQLDRDINPSQSATIEFTPNPKLVGKGLPKGHLKTEGLWAQGINVGIEYKF